jgi:two-component system, NarL family, response regulator LiaR
MDLIKVLIADAHAPFRQQLSRLLAEQADVQVVSEATDARQVLRRVEALHPHILLLDVQMPDTGGLQLLANIRGKSPETKILILADCLEEEFIAAALEHGVQGCLLKRVPPAELVNAVRTIHAGELWAQRKLLARVVERLRARVEELEGSAWQLREVLSEREQEVAILAVRGMTNKEIAVQLGISAKTVKTHLQNVFRKVKVRRRVPLSALSPYLGSSPVRTAPPSSPPADRTNSPYFDVFDAV